MAFSLLDVQNKFGGSGDIALSEYYRGGAYVPNVVGCYGVPTSGTISISQLQDASITSSSTDILSHVWNNRSSHFFKANSSNNWVWPGDTYDRNNSPVNRYITSYTISGGVGPAAPAYSGWTTIVALAAGSSSGITGLTTNASGNGYADYVNGEELSWWIQHIQTTPTSINSVSLTASRSGGNSGSWDKIIVLPGRWGIDQGAVTTNMAMGWSRTLSPGRIGWFATGTGYDGNMTPPSAGTTGYIIKGSEWWYNNSVSYVQFNPTGSNHTFQVGNVADNYGNPTGVWAYRRRYVEFYLIG